VRSLLEGLTEVDARPVLNHGDLRLKNVMVDREGHIIALIDWEHCLSNLVHWELAIALHDLSIDEKQAFLEGYGLSWKRVKELAPALKAINIINYAPHIGNAAQTRDTAGLEAYRLRLSGALDLYSL
jgi:hygromycin-B 4-O-kinase